jgi:hypothetical protein
LGAIKNANGEVFNKIRGLFDLVNGLSHGLAFRFGYCNLIELNYLKSVNLLQLVPLYEKSMLE